MNPAYKDQIINPLRELFLQDDFNNIPEIKINNNSDVFLISSNVSTAAVAINTSESEENQINDIFDSIGDYFSNESNDSYVDLINRTSSGLAEVIDKSYSELNDIIIPTVNDLKQKVITRYRGLIIREYGDDLKDEREPTDSDYSFTEWGYLNDDMTANDIISIACKNANLFNKELSMNNVSFILTKMFFSEGYNNINISDDIFNSIVDKMLIFFDKHGISKDSVHQFLKLGTDKLYYQNLCNSINNSINNNDKAVTILKIMDLVNKFDMIRDHYQSLINDSFNQDSFTSFVNNIEIVNNTMYALKYWLLCMKNIAYKDKLILNKNVLNREVYNNFVMQGKNIGDVYRYIRAYFGKVDIPLGGVSIDTINKSDYNNKLSTIDENRKASDQLIKARCLADAFILSINEFVNDTNIVAKYSKLEDTAFKTYFAQMAIANAALLKGDIGNIDQAIYLTIMNTIYNNTIISMLFRYLGVGFDTLVNTTDEITDEAILNSQCNAMINLVTDHLFNTVID